MSQSESLAKLLAPKFDDRLQRHLQGIDLNPLTRVPIDRLKQTALPNISLIELVSSTAFAQDYDPLYRANFHGGERERSDLIVTRLEDDFAGRRKGLFPYRIVGIRDPSGQVAGATQFSILLLPDGKTTVPYTQYVYVRPENRRQDLSALLQTLTIAVAMADGRSIRPGVDPIVPFMLFETEPPVHGDDDHSREKAAERIKIHAKSGGTALMLRRRSDGCLLSAHVQPGLEPGDPPITLTWALWSNPAMPLVLESDPVGKAVTAAYYQSLRDEGFPEENIAFAESIVERRYAQGCDFCLTPLSEVSKEMYVGIDD